MAVAQGTSEDHSGPREGRGDDFGRPAWEACGTPASGVWAQAFCVPPLCSAHTQECHFIPGPLWEQLAGPPRASAGGEGDRVWKPWLTRSPGASPLVCLVVDFLGTVLVDDRQDLVSQQIWRDKATQHFAGCLAL